MAATLLLCNSLAAQQSSIVERWFKPGTNGSGESSSSPTSFSWPAFLGWVQSLSQGGLPPNVVNGQDIQQDIVLHFLPGVHEDVLIYFTLGWRPLMTQSTPGGVAYVPNPNWNINNARIYIIGGEPDPVTGSQFDSASRPEDTVLRFPANYNAGSDFQGYGGIGIIKIEDDSLSSNTGAAITSITGGRKVQAQRVVVQNLTLDCNWRNQQAFSSLGAPLAYKQCGAYISAATGRLKGLIVRDHGTHGLICNSQYDNTAGVEAFPLLVQGIDEGQEPALDYDQTGGDVSRDPRPWLVERCEIHGFTQTWAGYNTAIMVNGINRSTAVPGQSTWVNHLVNPAFFQDPSRRFGLVRNCQIRGGSYGFGIAGNGWANGITFTGNATASSGGGFNGDTHAIVAADITNSAFIDVRVGVRQITTGYGTPDSINSVSVNGNLFRIGSRPPARRYQDYKSLVDGTGGPKAASDSSLVLGYDSTLTVSCYTIDGTTRDCAFWNNWTTTRAKDRFFAQNPADLPSAIFKPIWYPRPDELTPFYEVPAFPGATLVRPASVNIAIGENKLSSKADTFDATTAIGGSQTYSTFDSNSAGAPGGPTSDIAARDGGAFVNRAKTERLILFLSPSPDLTSYSWKKLSSEGQVQTVVRTFENEPRLQAVGEVQIAEPQVIDIDGVPNLQLQIKTFRHFLPSFAPGTVDENNILHTGSVPALSSSIRIKVEGQSTTILDPGYTAGSGNITVNFPIGTAGINDFYRITAYWNELNGDWGSNMDPSVSHEYHCAIASLTYRYNSVVDVSVSPDVANDRNTTFTAQRPVFTVRRSGPTTSALTVNLELPPYYRSKFNGPGLHGAANMTSVRVDGTYGWLSGQDFVLKLNNSTINVAGVNRTFSVTIPAGSSQVSVVLHPTYDDLTEEEVVYLRIAPGSGYARGPESTSLAFIYDGPEFMIYPLSNDSQTAAFAINSDLTPKVAGQYYFSSQSGSGWRGGQWTSPTWTGVVPLASDSYYYPLYLPPYSPIPYGVADTVSGQTWYAGRRWNGTRYVPWRGWPGTTYELQVMKAGGAGEAAAISVNPVDGKRVVGWGEALVGGSTYRHPTAWIGNSFSPTDLGSLLSSTGEGEATSVNEVGDIVGWSKKSIGSSAPPRGFQISGNRTAILATDERLPLAVLPVNLPDQNYYEGQSIVYSVAASGEAVGVSFLADGIATRRTNAAVWTKGVVQKLKVPIGFSGHSDALATTIPYSSGWKRRVLGRTWTTDINQPSVVMWIDYAVDPIPLLDAHYSGNTTGWILGRARSSNAQGWIVGEGKLNGIQRGFVLVRRNIL